GAKPNATVLMEHPTLRGRNGKPMPILAASEYGKGRTLALGTDSAWRWGFLAAGRDGDDGRAYQKFWDNAVRWLIRDPELEYLRVDSDQAIYRKGIAPRLSARLVDKDYRPYPNAEISLQVIPGPAPQKGQPAPKPAVEKKQKTDDAGEVTLETAPLPPGSYRLVGKATLGDRPVTAEDVFLVDPEREELEHPAAREDVLAGVAKATGGRYLGAADVLDAGL